MSYRDVASKQILIWACTSVGARVPVAMAPLALVFLVRERPGGYALGAALAAAFVIGEMIGAPVVGLRLRPDRARPQLAVALAAGAAGFVGLGVLPGVTAPSTAVLAGVALTLVLTAVGWWGETRSADRSAQDSAQDSARYSARYSAQGADPVAPAGRPDAPGPEGTAIRGRRDAEDRL